MTAGVPERATRDDAPSEDARGAVLTIAPLVIGIALRLWLALVNAEANDSHLPVIRIIAFEGRFPAWNEEWEAFQPKLYHTTVALLWRVMPDSSLLTLARAAQLVSCVAGILTLLVLGRFLRERSLPTTSRAIAVALASLSPGLIASSAQATNDAFVILFASLALLWGARFFTRWRAADFARLCLAATLAGISKGNGLVTLVAIACTFALAFVWPRLGGAGVSRRRIASYGATFALLAVPAVALIGPYARFQRTHGSPFVTNWKPSPRPHPWRETFVERPGITSLAHGLLTFRLGGLLREPASNDDRVHYPRHRTSLWSRLYAQGNSLRFENWPPSWASRDAAVLDLTRFLFILALVPAIAVVGGVWSALVRLARVFWHRDRHDDTAAASGSDSAATTALLLLAVAGHLAFVAAYAVRLRDYSSMKQVFILPALPALAMLATVGWERIAQWTPSRSSLTALRRVAYTAVVALLVGRVADVALLGRDLLSRPQRPNVRSDLQWTRTASASPAPSAPSRPSP